MITSISANVLFDSFIDREKHYFSPGGFEIVSKTGEHLQFDFMCSSGKIDTENRRIMHMSMWELDTESFSEAEHKLEDFLKNLHQFNEFFIYTGEEGEDELMYPVKVYDVCFENENYEEIFIDQNCLNYVNTQFAEKNMKSGKACFMYQLLNEEGCVAWETGFSNYSECRIDLGGHLTDGTTSVPKVDYRWRIFERKNGVFSEIENNIPIRRDQRRTY